MLVRIFHACPKHNNKRANKLDYLLNFPLQVETLYRINTLASQSLWIDNCPTTILQSRKKHDRFPTVVKEEVQKSKIRWPGSCAVGLPHFLVFKNVLRFGFVCAILVCVDLSSASKHLFEVTNRFEDQYDSESKAGWTRPWGIWKELWR